MCVINLSPWGIQLINLFLIWIPLLTQWVSFGWVALCARPAHGPIRHHHVPGDNFAGPLNAGRSLCALPPHVRLVVPYATITQQFMPIVEWLFLFAFWYLVHSFIHHPGVSSHASFRLPRSLSAAQSTSDAQFLYVSACIRRVYCMIVNTPIFK